MSPEQHPTPISDKDLSSDEKSRRRLESTGYFSHLDLHFAAFMERLDGRGQADIFLAAALVSRCNRAGHVCADLTVYAGQKIPGVGDIGCPALKDWLKLLENSPVVGRPEEFKPLILDHGQRLYLQRYWKYENLLARALLNRAAKAPFVDPAGVRANLARLFPDQSPSLEVNWQKVAAAVAACKGFCVISGGPGTGKTTTIARIMALLLSLEPGLAGRIALAAPTGKAADRMGAAIRQAKLNMDCPEEVRRHIPEAAATIHRLLGTIPDSPYFRHHSENPLPVSLAIVDEASMVDLALLAKLVQALPDEARLILVGDRNQLASVEAGAVLGDICGPADQNLFSKDFADYLDQITGSPLSACAIAPWDNTLGDCIVRLQHNYRFPGDGSFAAVGGAIRQGDGQAAFEALLSADSAVLTRQPLPPPADLERELTATVIGEYCSGLAGSDPRTALLGLNRFRLLCALREGPYGVVAINRLVEKILYKAGLISSPGGWYAGRLIMVTANDYHLRLFNGDIGMALPDPLENSELRVFFQGGDGLLRKFHPARLTAHETAFAVTVHKSQGSEYDGVLLLLPAHDAPVLTRELVYTGLTRARSHAAVWTDEAVFQSAVSRRVERFSGLGNGFWQVK